MAIAGAANFARDAVAHVSALSAGRSNAVAFGLSIIIGASVIFFIGMPGDDGRSVRAKRAAGRAIRKRVAKM